MKLPEIEIADKYKVVLSEDDPLFIMKTMIESLNNEARDNQERLLESYQNKIEAISESFTNESLTRAENIINASLLASKSAIDNQIKESMSKYINHINEFSSNKERNENRIYDLVLTVLLSSLTSIFFFAIALYVLI